VSKIGVFSQKEIKDLSRLVKGQPLMLQHDSDAVKLLQRFEGLPLIRNFQMVWQERQQLHNETQFLLDVQESAPTFKNAAAMPIL
jgi:hypothetical protein